MLIKRHEIDIEDVYKMWNLLTFELWNRRHWKYDFKKLMRFGIYMDPGWRKWATQKQNPLPKSRRLRYHFFLNWRNGQYASKIFWNPIEAHLIYRIPNHFNLEKSHVNIVPFNISESILKFRDAFLIFGISRCFFEIY